MANSRDLYNNGVRRVFASNLQDFLRRYDLTQTELARRMGLNASTISDWCRGAVLPRSNRLDQLCDVLHCEPDDLLGSSTAAAEEELHRRLAEMGVSPVPEADAIRRQVAEMYQTISRAMADLDEAALSRLAAYAEGLMASREDKNKPSAV